MFYVGGRKLFEKSFSSPHTPYLSKTLKHGGFIYFVFYVFLWGKGTF